MKLFENATDTLDLSSTIDKEWSGGEGCMAVSGTADGLTTTLYTNIENTGYTAVTEAIFTNTVGQLIFKLPNCLLKAVITGTAGSSSDISCTINGYVGS